MGARVVRLICSYCQKPFRGEHKQARQATACCSYLCDRWKRYETLRTLAKANWRYLRTDTRYKNTAWLISP